MNRLLGIISSRPITTTIFVVCCCFLMGDVWQRWWQVTPSLHLQSTASRSHEGLVAQRVVTPVGQVQPLEASPGFLPIEEIRVGMRVPASNPELTEADRAMFPNPDPASWRLLEMEQTKASGGLLRISMLRPIAWVHQRDVHQGGTLELALPEMGAVGPAEVVAIKPCPEIATGPGDVVLSTFVHPASEQLVDVTIGDGESRETISVTENHPFWSPEKNAFIPIGHFQSGDQLLTRDQQFKTITSLLARPGPPTDVYNLEVNGEHVYYVGQLELLVHNSCGPFVYAVVDRQGRPIYIGTGTKERVGTAVQRAVDFINRSAVEKVEPSDFFLYSRDMGGKPHARAAENWLILQARKAGMQFTKNKGDYVAGNLVNKQWGTDWMRKTKGPDDWFNGFWPAFAERDHPGWKEIATWFSF